MRLHFNIASKQYRIAAMMQIKPAFKVTILPMIKSTLKLTRENMSTVIKLSWLVMLFYMIKGPLDYYLMYSSDMMQWVDSVSGNTYLGRPLIQLFFMIYDGLLLSILSYGLLSLFITDKDIGQKYEYKRGIKNPKTVLTLRWFISLAKPVWVILGVSMIVGVFFFLCEQALFYTMLKYMETKMQFADYDFTKLAYVKYGFEKLIFIAEELTYAAMLLIWPAIILGKFKFSKIMEYIKPLKGNIIRLAIIGILIFMPTYLINGGYNGILTIYAYMDKEIPLWATGDLYQVMISFMDAAYFISFIVYSAFIGLFYKTLKDGGKI